MPNFFKILATACVIAITLFSYTQCLGPTGSSSKSKMQFNTTEQSSVGNSNSNPVVSNSVASVDAFAQTLHPLTKQRCVACHGSFQQPLHAVSDPQQAHDAIINAFKVNFTNPSSSRMYLKLRDEAHNCWSDCTQNANEILTAINSWKDLLDSSNNPQDSGNNQGTTFVTDESQTVEQMIDMSSQNQNGTIQLAIDTATLKAPMVKGQEGENSYIWVVNNNVGVLANNNNTAGTATLNFSTDISANYRMYALVNAPTDSDNSFHIKVDNGNYQEWHIPLTTGYEWREVKNTSAMNPVTFFIPMGAGHMLEIRQREDGTKISKIYMTDDLNFDVSQINLNPKATLTYNIGKLLNTTGIEFKCDVEIYDDFSYKLTNPRITTNRSLYVKNVKLLINGQFNPQHATYTLVDMQIPIGTTQLSNRAMVALKDKGDEYDTLSFSFEMLELK